MKKALFILMGAVVFFFVSLSSYAQSVSVDPSSGSANLPIRIQTPPGRAGIEPNVSLVYNSGNRQQGLVGVGWSLDLGSIMVSTKHGAAYS